MDRSDLSSGEAGIQRSNLAQHVEDQDGYSDRWIGLRDKLFNRLGGIQAGDVLNVMTAGSVRYSGADPAAELKQALDLVKTSAVDVSGTRVDYDAMKGSPAYQHYRNTLSPGLAGFDPMTLKSRSERLVFWINLYNALVIDAVIFLGIQHSLIEGKLGLLTFFRRAAYNVGGHRISLDDIENGILRGNQGHPLIPGRQFKRDDPRFDWIIWPPEPRVHFALNCASRSCPPIRVYTPDQIELQLDQATRSYIYANIGLDPVKQQLIVSSIFKWFKSDFGGETGIISFIVDHLPLDGRRAWLTKFKDIIRLRYKPYDWRLNSI